MDALQLRHKHDILTYRTKEKPSRVEEGRGEMGSVRLSATPLNSFPSSPRLAFLSKLAATREGTEGTKGI